MDTSGDEAATSSSSGRDQPPVGLTPSEYCALLPTIESYHRYNMSSGQYSSLLSQRVRAPAATVRLFDCPKTYKHFIRSCSIKGAMTSSSAASARSTSSLASPRQYQHMREERRNEQLGGWHSDGKGEGEKEPAGSRARGGRGGEREEEGKVGGEKKRRKVQLNERRKRKTQRRRRRRRKIQKGIFRTF